MHQPQVLNGTWSLIINRTCSCSECTPAHQKFWRYFGVPASFYVAFHLRSSKAFPVGLLLSGTVLLAELTSSFTSIIWTHLRTLWSIPVVSVRVIPLSVLWSPSGLKHCCIDTLFLCLWHLQLARCSRGVLRSSDIWPTLHRKICR